MAYRFLHNNYNVADLERSIGFYQRALGLMEIRRITVPDGSFILVFLGLTDQQHQIELTWLKEHQQAYDLGENETHLAFATDDYQASLVKHQEMGCVCYINEAMGLYFIEDPDGYWIEILPER